MNVAGDAETAQQTVREATARLVPVFMLLYLFNYLNRANVGFGNLSAFVGAYLTGWTQTQTGGFRPGLWLVGEFMTTGQWSMLADDG